MPKASGFKDLIHSLEIRDANKLPQEGFFSTLDELIGAAPQERMTVKQWREYLAPGRILEREGVKFPLKKEELEYSLPGYVLKSDPVAYPGKDETFMTRDQLREITRRTRPGFRRDMGLISGGQYNSYSTQGPLRVDYFESETESPDFGKFDTHFTPETLSWHRGTRHDLAGDGYPGGGILRLIDEIQSDRHAAAADRGMVDPEGRWGTEPYWMGRVDEESYARLKPKRRGYRTPEQEAELDALSSRGSHYPRLIADPEAAQRFNELKRIPPDAPFKSAGDYARLELKKSLLDAVDKGDRYLGVTPSEGPIGWFKSGEAQVPGMKHAYDSVYPGELKKLAQQYGAPFQDVELTVQKRQPRSIPALENPLDDNPIDFADFVNDIEDIIDGTPLEDLDVYPRVVMAQMRDATDNPEVHRSLDAAQVAMDQYVEKVKAAQRLEGSGYVEAGEAGAEYAKADEALRAWQNAMREAWRYWNEDMDPGDVGVRKIPAMEITPEVAERILKAGVPLWAIAAGVVGLDQLTGEPTEGPAFGKGGPVTESAALLKRLMDDPITGPLLREGQDRLQREVMQRAAEGRRRRGLPNYDARFDELVQKYNPERRSGGERRITRLPDRIIEREEPVKKSAGGFVATPEEDRARKNAAMQKIDRIATYIGTPDKARRRRHLAAGLLSQVYGLNSDGDASFLGMDKDAPTNSDPSGSGMGELAFPSIRPGMFDEVLALPAMFGGGPEVSQNAVARTENLAAQINDSMGLEAPRGFDENFSRSLGVMLGQLPVPALKAKAVGEAGRTGIRKLGQLAKKYGTGATEFFSPVVTPSVGAYASGALFGGTLGTMPEWLEAFIIEHPEVAAKIFEGNPVPEGYGDRQQEVGFAYGGGVGMDDPNRLGLLAAAGGNKQYTGSPRTEAQLANYGEGPEASHFANNRMVMPEIDWSRDGTGVNMPAATEGGGNNALIGVLGSLPQIYKGIGMVDKFLGTDMQGGIKNLGGKVYDYGKDLLGFGSAAAGSLPGTVGNLATWGGSAGSGTIGSLSGAGFDAMNAASPLGQATLNLGSNAGSGASAASNVGQLGGASKLATGLTNLGGGLLAGYIGNKIAGDSKYGQALSNIGTIGGTMLSGGSGIALGSQLGMAAGPVGALAGAVLGAVAGKGIGKLLGKDVKQDLMTFDQNTGQWTYNDKADRFTQGWSDDKKNAFLKEFNDYLETGKVGSMLKGSMSGRFENAYNASKKIRQQYGLKEGQSLSQYLNSISQGGSGEEADIAAMKQAGYSDAQIAAALGR